jgi:beta-glucosidase
MHATPFPDSFLFGCATSAYQIEGAADEDGRGPSVWDAFCLGKGAVFGGHSGAVACDHVHRFREDVALMRELGMQAYRFSISWPRVLPEGVGAVNERGLAFYDRLVDALLEARIRPFVTLFHWDLPLALERRGGWRSARSPGWFAEYAGVVVERLSDRVTDWMTLNEPQCFVGLGHGKGEHAPGHKLPLPELLRVGHHALLAHGLAVQSIRARARRPCAVGYAPVGVVFVPASGSAADLEAARRRTFSAPDDDLWCNTFWMDPVLLGRYPEDFLARVGRAMPAVPATDLETIAQPLDFLGLNIYSGRRVSASDSGEPREVPFPAGHPTTALSWWVVPEAMHHGPRFFAERYRLPLLITENGMADLDAVSLDGAVHDPQRIDFIERYLLELARAIGEGVDVRGYFHWSLLDNFEWSRGYGMRFGLIHTDYATQKRTPKDSARFYAEVISSRGVRLGRVDG